MAASTSLAELLQQARERLEEMVEDGGLSVVVKSIHAVVGNSSCDLDSVACTLALSHYYHNSHTLGLPLLQCPRDDLPTRRDTVWVLDKLGISTGQLILYDDVNLTMLKPPLSISLVDHNLPSLSLRTYSHDITECIDHHHDDKHLPQTTSVTIEPVGSCSTLVAEKLKKATENEEYEITKEVATLLLAAILLDTTNLTSDKATDKDRAMAAYLEPLSLIPDLYEPLEQARWSVQGLTLPQLLRADCKRVEGDGCAVVFCTIRCLMFELVERYQPSWADELQAFISDQGAHVVVLGLMDRAPFRRQLYVMERTDLPPSLRDVAEVIATRLESEANMDREVGAEISGILLNQRDNTMSRKQILPLVMSYIDSGRLSPPPVPDVEVQPPIAALSEVEVQPPSPPPDPPAPSSDAGEENDQDQLSESRQGSLLQLESISAKLGESVDSLALAQDSDGRSSTHTPSPVGEEERVLLEARGYTNHPLEPNVTILSSSSSDDAAVLPTPQATPQEPIPEYTWREENEASRSFRTVTIGGEEHRVSLKLIEPYRLIVQHGGYVGKEQTAIVVLSASYLPSKSLMNYPQVVTQLFYYVLSVVDRLVVDDYVIVYLHSGAPPNSMPGIQLFHRFYCMIDRRLRKNLKHLYIVHPSFWVKAMLRLARPFISGKFYRKVHFIQSLKELYNTVPIDQYYIPKTVMGADEQINRHDYTARTPPN